ncbi:hypothetical protein E0Z10_g2973 [Xylaria hypoxylon]|uniref:Uncharacterized protein n=1 Tax=Xylaria hypoxylon TaxID=37992 RepID=A0A4Z0YPQ4_9PEZI|nr:hypothetical protein E0Z10_g2973 [Xylaria hypoxylon]
MTTFPSIRYNQITFEPFAQVTIIDSFTVYGANVSVTKRERAKFFSPQQGTWNTNIDKAWGDANLVDICQHSEITTANKWRRVLIDTGPPSEDITASCEAAICEVSLPQEESSQDNQKVPPLNEFQITHSDSDHIGNAHKLTESEREEGIRKQALVKLSDTMLEWARDIALFGYKVEFELRFEKPMKGSDFSWKKSNLNVDNHGATTHGLICYYSEKYDDLADGTKLEVNVKITDTDGAHGNRLAFKEKYYTWLKCFKGKKWPKKDLDKFTGQLIRTTEVTGLAALPAAPTLEIRKPRTRMNPDIPGYLNKLGMGVEKLVRRKLAVTDIALHSKKHTFTLDGEVIAVQHYVSPSVNMYRNLGRLELIEEYQNKDYDPERDKIATNRSSTVTYFHRRDLGLKMLFTADAYDRNCDIRSTIFSYTNQENWYIDLPHHGSQVTVDSSFYEVVRAEVYLVCGYHGNVSANPRLATLVAIVKSFENRKRPSGEPFRLFFSSSSIMEDAGGNQSTVAALIGSRWGPKLQQNGQWNYELYRTKSNCGRILFGAQKPAQAHPVLVETVGSYEWIRCH